MHFQLPICILISLHSIKYFRFFSSFLFLYPHYYPYSCVFNPHFTPQYLSTHPYHILLPIQADFLILEVAILLWLKMDICAPVLGIFSRSAIYILRSVRLNMVIYLDHHVWYLFNTLLAM